ncbi:NlpC/P60 family protein [Actibacterium lipolyticum]|uniref:NlpC/P60 domain-containing protein n=1 Tax=Actibacterium lipolyticum TaxID=1524263 RepID=A0A238KH42_9RHOB|nr:NlpC/P60 family protein [Actibacterium lipolyticum]SMX42018.1 hypothetical protein COL8621_01872 [Actibacterium lipolyticum]
MSALGERAVCEARRWLGTPYRHQASVCGGGADCLGLFRGLWRAFYGCEPEPLPSYAPDWSEVAEEERLWQGLARHLIDKRLEQADPGDVVLLRMRDGSVAKHLGIQAGVGADASFIHAYYGHGVVESPLSRPWARRIVARFEFPNGRD